ncbi:hypothetical protein LP421_03095 (plasmid) [Rhizobium sp. RCAM05350]|nr:hypothetical protein LP421_03095 [Rhizobium sp. RCAM05350]
MFLASRRDTLKLVAGTAVIAMAGAFLAPVKAALASDQFSLTRVRNATLRIDYAGIRFLIDPMFASKGATPGFE